MGAYLDHHGGGPEAVALLACYSPLGSAMGMEGLEPVHFQKGFNRASQEGGADGGRRGRIRNMI